ncbi:MAG: cephalosporin hydroxylase family protein [Actinomycetota bacterium]|nr:cephalosporin hydroxylase family protein [Actinomycetota bacterium]
MSEPASQSADLGRTITVSASGRAREVDIYSEEGFRVLSELWTRSGWQNRLSYEVTWLGVPIIQLPEDMVIVQELLWRIRPDVVVECGVAHGGALLLYASILELIGRGRVVGVDVEIRKYNRLAIESHPLSRRIELVEGSSLDPAVVDYVHAQVPGGHSVLLALDSNHTREHVRQELECYAPLVTPGSYAIVFDTVMPLVADAPGAGPGWDEDNPLEAVRDFLGGHPEFEIDTRLHRLGATYCHSGFLRRLEEPSDR